MSEAATLDSLPLLASGKVREMYDLGDRLLMVASDRISTYDVVHPTPIPGKGQVLTGISVFWFERTGQICRNHVVSYTDVPDEAKGRALLVDRLEMFPVECVARGYLTGSGWKDYLATGSVCGIELPAGLEESQQLPEPIFTPATKAEVGDHDENVDFDRAAEILGDRPLLEELRRLTLELYSFAADHARERGIILADTKFEFGRASDGADRARRRGADARLVALLAGRQLRGRPRPAARSTSSTCATGRPAPAGTRRRRRRRCRTRWSRARAQRYEEAYERITGEPFSAWLEKSGALRARVLIRPKEGILDPQGQTVERALPALGFEGVSEVRIGRLVELEVPDIAEVEAMCEKLLANPLVEDYEVVAVE